MSIDAVQLIATVAAPVLNVAWFQPAMKEHRISSDCSFVQFADATVDVAREQFDEDVAEIVRSV